MTIEIRKPELERRVRERIQSGDFRDIDELLTRALDALQKAETNPSMRVHENPPRTREEAVDHILEARKGNRLPEGVTIRDLINQGRA